MANNLTSVPRHDAPDRELALWMLERMRDSQDFLGVIRAARSAGGRDVLDTPAYIARQRARLAPLYQGGPDETVDLPVFVVDRLDAIAQQDLLSCNEETVEKILAAFLAANPNIAATVPANWPTTFDMAKAEVEGRTRGSFKPGFAADLATAARSELARRAELDKGRRTGRDDDRSS